jgi:hypothetical protein
MNGDRDDVVEQLKRQNRLLKQLLGASSIGLAVLLLSAATSTGTRAKFSEIDVERINIIMPDGKPEIVIANRQRIPDPVVDGKPVKSDRHFPGLIFYNAIGDENGGLIFDGKLDDKGKPAAGMHFSMDRFGGDQQLALGHYEDNGTMETGFNVYDRGLAKDYAPLWEAYEKTPAGPEKDALLKRFKEAGGQQTKRVFVGKTRAKSSAVVLADAQGHPKIMMLVEPDGTPSLQFFDNAGKVIQRLPQTTDTK